MNTMNTMNLMTFDQAADVFARYIDLDAAYIALVRDRVRQYFQHNVAAKFSGDKLGLERSLHDVLLHARDAETREQLFRLRFVERTSGQITDRNDSAGRARFRCGPV